MFFRITDVPKRARSGWSLWESVSLALAEARAERRVLLGK